MTPMSKLWITKRYATNEHLIIAKEKQKTARKRRSKNASFSVPKDFFSDKSGGNKQNILRSNMSENGRHVY